MRIAGEKPFIVELAGLPGTGKSTSVAALAPVTTALPLTAYLRPRNIPFLARRAVPLARLLPGSSPAAWARHLRWMLRVEGTARVLPERREGTDVVVLDQGPVYTLVRLHEVLPMERPALARWWARQAALWSRRLDLLVVLDAADDVLVPRIQLRAKQHVLKETSRPDAARSLAGQRLLWDSVIPELEGSGALPVLRLDTARRTPEELAERILSAVQAIASGRSADGAALPGRAGA